ncbi:thioredoxin [Dictyocaulus viviparus]|uniref:Thioredoxin n=1 Tax=Dictyocaulus viviparus TaxID=29172 RepID=A0A0D8XDA6_DICVI|nr:thioredoxin [Dictyocaulus viviparus]
MYYIIFVLITRFVFGEEAVGTSKAVWSSCHRYNEKEIFLYFLQKMCPCDYDNKCNDPIMDPYGAFKYRCQTVYPNNEKLFTVDIMNASTLLSILPHTDMYKRTWCMVTLFYAPMCPFSARIAPFFNALPKIYNGSIKFVALDATEFSKLNSRYGITGTPTVILWVNGAAVARMEDRYQNDVGLMSFVYDWTDMAPAFGTVRSMDGPLHIEFDDRPDVFYLSLSLLVVYIVIIYYLRDSICGNVHVRGALAWISARIDDLSGYFAVQPRAELQ